MKKMNLLVIALATTMLASCGKSSGGYSTGSSDTGTGEHEHVYDNAGLCSCGESLSYNLNDNQAYGNENVFFSSTNKKIYFEFYCHCPSTFYLDEYMYAISSTLPDSDFPTKIDSINIYKDGALNVDLYSALEVEPGYEDDGDEKYLYYQSKNNLEKETQYHVVLNMKEDVYEYELFFESTSFHYNDEKSWEDSADHTTRSTTWICSGCGAEETETETYIYDVQLPDIKLTSGISIADNISLLGQSIVVNDGNVVFRPYGCTDHSNSDIVESSGIYFLNIYLYATNDHCFNKSSLIIRDASKSIVTIKGDCGEYGVQCSLIVGVA